MMAPIGDRLLWAITAKERISLQSFNNLFDQLAASEVGMDEADLPRRRRVTSWMLNALGHCETFIDGGTSYLEPSVPCLSRLPVSGLPRAMLTGGRQPRTGRDVERAAAKLGGVVIIEPSEHPLAVLPNHIEIEAELPDTLQAIARELNIAWQATPSAWVLCNLSASLDDVLNRLEWGPAQGLNWRHRFFDPRLLRLRDEVVDGDPTLIRYEHPYTRRLRFELRRGQSAAVVDGDWGRYAVLREAQRHVLVYDERRYLFAVPWGVPVPPLLRRALTCCSGRPPKSIRPNKRLTGDLSATGANVFLGVVPAIASQVSTRIGQHLTHGNLSQIGD
ncbi:hypothetical protein [Rhodococcus koreensis]|uniref:hypothetical protein n=1 Tax=Rhodococcus koreensis TaxID=99653 RepID=UPI0036DACC85